MFFKRKYISKHQSNRFNLIKLLPLSSVLLLLFLFGFSNSYDKPWTFDWSGIKLEVKDSILKVKRFGRIVTSASEDESYSKQLYTQSWLYKNTKTSELVYLLNFPDSNIKALSYDILLKKKKVDKYSLIKKSLEDTLSFVKLAGGCLRYDMHLVEYLLKHQLGYKTNRVKGFYQIEKDLTLKQINEIDSLYNDLKRKEDYYKQIVYGEEYPITDYNWD